MDNGKNGDLVELFGVPATYSESLPGSIPSIDDLSDLGNALKIPEEVSTEESIDGVFE